MPLLRTVKRGLIMSIEAIQYWLVENYSYKTNSLQSSKHRKFVSEYFGQNPLEKNSITTIAKPSDNLFPQKLKIYFVSESLNDIWSPGLKIDFRFTFDKSRIKWNRSFQKPRKKTSVRYRVVNAKRWRKKSLWELIFEVVGSYPRPQKLWHYWAKLMPAISDGTFWPLWQERGSKGAAPPC